MAEPSQIGLTTGTHEKLKGLKEQGHFSEMGDAYRFAIALAIMEGADPPELVGSKQTTFSTSTLDGDESIKAAIECLFERAEGEPIYRAAERLAEWGVNELAKLAEKGSIDISGLLTRARNSGH
jgi:hypothetical protein